jgi:hypothetical protein
MRLGKSNPVELCCVLILFASLIGCAVNLVQPYDADLYANTEAFYKKASAMIAKGMNASPKTSDEIKAIKKGSEEKHPGHFNQFKDDYDALLIDSNSLILRSLSNSGQINALGMQIQAKIEEAITSNIPGSCDSMQDDFPGVSLTTRNYIDLKCLIGSWSEVHQGRGPSGDITFGKMILKKSIWEGRAKTLFDGILAIQKAEASKKEK